MRPRFYVPGVNSTLALVELPEDEAEHLVRVLRLGVGDEIDVIDGRGGLWRAEVVQAGKKSAVIRPLEPGTPARELGPNISLVVSVLKGDKLDDVVRDAVMLGDEHPAGRERALRDRPGGDGERHADSALAADCRRLRETVRPRGGAADLRRRAA